MQNKIKVKFPIIVEGRYDKSTLSSIIDGTVITTGGFGIFNSEEKKALIRRLGENGIILLTDSDGGGRQIRSFISGLLPKEKIHHLYIPEIEGKEKRKRARSKAGLLGVEGMSREVIERLFLPFSSDGEPPCEKHILTKTEFYLDGFSGRENSSEKRDKLSLALELPRGLSQNALIEAINLLGLYEKYKDFGKDGENDYG